MVKCNGFYQYQDFPSTIELDFKQIPRVGDFIKFKINSWSVDLKVTQVIHDTINSNIILNCDILDAR